VTVLRLALGASALSSASLCAATADAQQRVPTHVACVGDSITFGFGASSSATNYPADLQKLLGSTVKVQNFGHSGATMLSTGDLPYVQQPEYASATTFVSGAGASAVVDVIIMLGTNDSKPVNWTSEAGDSSAQFRTDCAAMVDHFASLPTHPVVYLALPPTAYTNTFGISGTLIHDAIIPIIEQFAAQKGMPIIDVNTPTAGQPSLFVDGVHPNDTGYQLVAQIMYDGLRMLQPDGGAAEGGAGDAGSPDSGPPDMDAAVPDAAPSDGGPGDGAPAASDSGTIADAAIPVFDGGAAADAASGSSSSGSGGGQVVPADTGQSSGCTMETDRSGRGFAAPTGWTAAAALALLSGLRRLARRSRVVRERADDRARDPNRHH
jgi:lysophospholipase L1-like esterase